MSNELDPRLRAGIQKWVDTDKVTPEVQASVEDLLKSSSLARLHFEIWGGLRKGDRVAIIQQNDEFSSLWKPKDTATELERTYADKGKLEHAKYIAFGAPFSKEGNLGATIASSPVFGTYIEYTRRVAEVGPAFLKVLDVIPYTDVEGLKFFAQNIDVFAALDQEYYAAVKPDQKKENQEAKNVRQFVEAVVMDALFLPASCQEWRNFVRSNFSLIYVLASSSWFSSWSSDMPSLKKDPLALYRSIESHIHHPEDINERFQRIFFLEFIIPYFTRKTVFSVFLEKIAEAEKNGNLRIVRNVYEFANAVRSFHPEEKHLLDAFFDGKITYDQFQANLSKLESSENKIRELPEPHAKALRTFMGQGLFLDFDPSFIYDHDIFPTELVTSVLREKGQEGIEELVRLKKKTKRGEFDPNNPLQKDLEFMSYLSHSRFDDKDQYKSFSMIPFVERTNEPSVLNEIDKMEARAAAFEAARVYWMIRERTDKGKKVMIVGNNRYGRLFVTEPLKSELELLNDLEMVDSIGSKYVRSHSGRDVKRGEQIFSENNLRRIASNTPDIIIVDGTQNNTSGVDEDKTLPRFSSAMRGFYNWVVALNEGKFGVKPKKPYGITFHSFIESDQVILDDHEDKEEILSTQSGSLDSPQVIIVNSTINPGQFPGFPEDLMGHEAGYFDDPEEKVGENRTLVFTKNGLQEMVIKQARDVSEYVSAAQKAIEESLLEMIMSKSTQKI